MGSTRMVLLILSARLLWLLPLPTTSPMSTPLPQLLLRLKSPWRSRLSPLSPQLTYAVPQVYTHAVSSVGVPASTELLTKTAVAAPAIQYVAAPYAPLPPFVSGIPVAAPAAPAAPAAEEAAGVEVA